jgi:uncharacterized iron-regulated protein
MKRKMILLTILVTLFIGSESSSDTTMVLRVRDGKVISFSQMMEEMRKIDIVLIGEVHDERDHHRMQLAIIKALHEEDVPMAVGLEMFKSNNQAILDSWVQGKLPLDRFLPEYYDNWGLPWPLYQDIYWYAREHQISLVGLNVPGWLTGKVAKQGFDALTKEERKLLPPGISCNVDAKYREFVKKAYSGHPSHDHLFDHFCEAQMVWDKSMAWHVVQYLKKNPGKTVVVLAGVGHAWKRGIPEQIAIESSYSYRVVLPIIPDQIEKSTVTTKDADYVFL